MIHRDIHFSMPKVTFPTEFLTTDFTDGTDVSET